MNIKNQAYIYAFYYLNNQCNLVYHAAAQKLGLSDCALSIFFILTGYDKKFTQSEICDKLCIRKQTINSALQKMKAEGYISLTRTEEKTGKYIVLTEKGKEFADKNIVPLLRIEDEVCGKFTEEEKVEFLKQYRRLVELLIEENEKEGISIKL